MDFLGIGPLELLLILIILLVVVGPEKLPDFARRLGHAVRAFRGATSNLTRELERELRLGESTSAVGQQGVEKGTEKATPDADDQGDGPKGKSAQ